MQHVVSKGCGAHVTWLHNIRGPLLHSPTAQIGEQSQHPVTVGFCVDIRLSAEAACAIPAFAEWMTDLPGKVQVIDDLSIHTEQDGPDWAWDNDCFFEAKLLKLRTIFPHANSFKLHLAGSRQRTAVSYLQNISVARREFSSEIISVTVDGDEACLKLRGKGAGPTGERSVPAKQSWMWTIESASACKPQSPESGSSAHSQDINRKAGVHVGSELDEIESDESPAKVSADQVTLSLTRLSTWVLQPQDTALETALEIHKKNSRITLYMLNSTALPRTSAEIRAEKLRQHEAAMGRLTARVQELLSKGFSAGVENAVSETCLLESLQKPYAAFMQQLSDEGDDTDAISAYMDSQTVLHLAAAGGDCDVLQTLLDAQAELEAKDSCGWTPLHMAVANGHSDAVATMLGASADVQARGEGRTSALHLAAAEGDCIVLQTLLDGHAKTEAKDSRGWTPLHLAARSGHLEAIATLLKASANVHARTKDGLTGLHLATGIGDCCIIQHMLDWESDVDARDVNGNSPLHRAVSFLGDKDVVQMLLSAGADARGVSLIGHTPLHLAAHKGHDEIIEALLMRQVDIEACDASGWRPLHVAARYRQPRAVQLLLQAGANSKVTIDCGQTALFMAIGSGSACAEIVQQLAANKEATEVSTPEGWTPLMKAASWGLTGIVKLLIANGAHIRAQNSDGATALHFAAMEGQCQTVQVLLELGAQLDGEDTEGTTPLHMAAKSGELDVVELLLAHGANPDVQDWRGRTAFLWVDLAEETPQIERIIQALINGKADVNQADYDQQTMTTTVELQEDVAPTALLREAGAKASSDANKPDGKE